MRETSGMWEVACGKSGQVVSYQQSAISKPLGARCLLKPDG